MSLENHPALIFSFKKILGIEHTDSKVSEKSVPFAVEPIPDLRKKAQGYFIPLPKTPAVNFVTMVFVGGILFVITVFGWNRIYPVFIEIHDFSLAFDLLPIH
ncbi:MAG: hypothetical protein WCS52_18400 [bacterium]